MDPTRFDALVRSFASGGTRRRLVALLAVLPLGGTLLTLEGEEATAERPRDRVKRRNKQHHRKKRNQRHKKKNNHKNRGGKGGGNPNTCTPNGKACQQNSDCCGGNCFTQACADAVTACGGVDCPAGATGCCQDGCCSAPANQCNAEGLCCAPNCGGRECGPDGCGGSGACGSCKRGQSCNAQTGQCIGIACSPASCPDGCCDEDGDCQPGNTKQACGDGGEICTVCGPNQFCSTETGTCRDNPPCSPTSCPNGCCDVQDGHDVCRTDRPGCGPGGPCCSGCCDDSQECQPGTDGGACGIGGSRCVACDPLHDACDQGRCQCDANNCPNGCCDRGPGQPGLCFGGCGTGGVLCKADIGEQCTQDSDCCLDNCFGGACADTVTECAGITCAKVSKGCCGTTCCDDAATCCGAGASCQNNQCICNGQQCAGCCEHGPGNPGRCLENAPPQCGIGGAPCQSCADGCCDVGGSCQSGNTIENCASASGTCQTCNDRLEVCQGEQCVVCEHDCPCQGQSLCDGTTMAPNIGCGTNRIGRACSCMVKSNFQPVCMVDPFLVPCTVTCIEDSDCQLCYGSLAMCVLGGPRCDLIPGTATNFCALPCEK